MAYPNVWLDCFGVPSPVGCKIFCLFLEFWLLDHIWHWTFLCFLWWTERLSCFWTRPPFTFHPIFYLSLQCLNMKGFHSIFLTKTLVHALSVIPYTHGWDGFSLVFQPISFAGTEFVKFPAEIHIAYVYSTPSLSWSSNTMTGRNCINVVYFFLVGVCCFQAISTFFSACYHNIYLIVCSRILPGICSSFSGWPFLRLSSSFLKLG